MKRKKKVEKAEEDELLKKLLDQVHKQREEEKEEFADQMCFATVSLLIACEYGKIAFKDKNVYFHSKSGTTYVVSFRRVTEEEVIPEPFE